jgi:peptide/nickel transport system ATP-binding protein
MGRILEVKDLSVEYYARETSVTVLRNVDLTLEKGECIGIVGESGCGKSTLAAAILKLIDKSEGAIKCPSINYFSDNNENGINLLYGNFKNSDTMIRGYGGNNLISPDWSDRERKRTPRLGFGSECWHRPDESERPNERLAPMEVSCAKHAINLMDLSAEEMRKIRGKKISMIMQDPYSSLNPVIRIGNQLKEAYLVHNDSYEKADEVIREKLEQVHLPPDNTIIDAYPHQLSGGMLQRVSIAMALLNSPDLLIADEPTSNLDVTIQKKIIENLKGLKKSLNLSMIFITHNLNLVSEFADRIFILYAGKFAEYGPAQKIFSNPAHPYTKGLLGALPHVSKIGERISPIPGFVPSPLELPKGCSFSPRCEVRKEECVETEAGLREIEPGHFVRCLWE